MDVDPTIASALIGAMVIVVGRIALFAYGYGKITARQQAMDERSNERYRVVDGRLWRIERTLNGRLTPAGGDGRVTTGGRQRERDRQAGVDTP